MRPKPRTDAAYLWDMRRSARTVSDFVADASFADYMENHQLRLAVERGLEIIGEAAGRVSSAFRAEHPEIPWRDMVGLRNVLAHDYAEIVDQQVWDVAFERLPELISHLDALLSV